MWPNITCDMTFHCINYSALCHAIYCITLLRNQTILTLEHLEVNATNASNFSSVHSCTISQKEFTPSSSSISTCPELSLSTMLKTLSIKRRSSCRTPPAPPVKMRLVFPRRQDKQLADVWMICVCARQTAVATRQHAHRYTGQRTNEAANAIVRLDTT